MKNSKGISLIALIITIIVIVILAAVVVTTSIDTPKSASFAVFCSDMGEIQQAVSLKYADMYTTAVVAANGIDSAVDKVGIYEEIATGTNGTGTGPFTVSAANKIGLSNVTKYLTGSTESDVNGLTITATGIVYVTEGFMNNGTEYYNASDDSVPSNT